LHIRGWLIHLYATGLDVEEQSSVALDKKLVELALSAPGEYRDAAKAFLPQFS
jgi:hypothetical protein